MVNTITLGQLLLHYLCSISRSLLVHTVDWLSSSSIVLYQQKFKPRTGTDWAESDAGSAVPTNHMVVLHVPTAPAHAIRIYTYNKLYKCTDAPWLHCTISFLTLRHSAIIWTTHDNVRVTTTLWLPRQAWTCPMRWCGPSSLVCRNVTPFLKLDIQSTVLRVFHQSMYSHLSCWAHAVLDQCAACIHAMYLSALASLNRLMVQFFPMEVPLSVWIP